MKLIPQSKKQGFSLPVVLMAVVIITAFLFAILALLRPLRSGTDSDRRSYDWDLASESALSEALGTLVHSTTRDHFVSHLVNDAEGDPDHYVISWFEPDRELWVHQPLIAGCEAEELSQSGSLDLYADYSGLTTSDVESMEMVDLGWKSDLSVRFSRSVPKVEFENGLSYSWWIEDLNGRLDYEALSYVGRDHEGYDSYLNAGEQKQRKEAEVVDQRHLGLYVLANLEAGEFETDYNDPFARRLTNPLESGSPPEHPFASIFEEGLAPYLVSESVVMLETGEKYPYLRGSISYGLPDTIQSEIVPYGFDYKNAGEPKMNLNEKVDRANGGNGTSQVQQIADQIKNVRGFKDNASEYAEVGILVDDKYPLNTRYGGFPCDTESYCKTLAASILDYADTDSAPSAERTQESGNYRGVDSCPLCTEASRRYYFSDATSVGLVLQIRNFVELYNPTNHTVHGYLKFNLYPDEDHKVSVGGVSYPLPPEELYYWNGVITIEPNSYRVLELTQDLDGDFVGEDEAYLHYELPDSSGALTGGRTSSSYNKIEFRWYPVGTEDGLPPEDKEDFCLVDGVINGTFKIAHTGLINTLEKDANNTLYGMPLYEGTTGDPRATFYCQAEGFGSLNYARATSFGGPNDYQTDPECFVSNETLFPDGCYDAENHGIDVRGCTQTPSRGMRYPGEYGYVKWDNPEGVMSKNLEEAAGNRKSQYYVTQSEDHDLRWIQRISNKGYFTSLGELGCVFDPAQWRYVRRPSIQLEGMSVMNEAYWTDDYFRDEEQEDPEDRGIEQFTAKELGEFGGGMTLAIGSPEFHCYVSDDGGERRGYESARLLDQFRVTGSPIRSLKSRVNLNTAPRRVLLAIFAGFLHQDDKIMGEFVRQPKNYTDKVASALADGIIEARKERPFLSLSDIALAQSAISGSERKIPVFGEKLRYESNDEESGGFSIHQELWNDYGREELFRRMCDMFTTQSRSYRIHLQVENPSSGVGSVVRKSVDVTLHPYLNEDLSVDTSRPSQVKIHQSNYK